MIFCFSCVCSDSFLLMISLSVDISVNALLVVFDEVTTYSLSAA